MKKSTLGKPWVSGCLLLPFVALMVSGPSFVQEVSEEEIERYKETKKAAKEEKIAPELQPIYDFETDEFSLWLGLEFGKMVAPGKIAYIKPGWGIDNSEATDRESTLEVGFRWFF